MTEYLATKSGPGDSTTPRGVVLGVKGVYTVPASGPGDGDTLVMCTIPPGATILGLTLYADGGVGSLTIKVGDGTSATRFGTVSDATAAFEHVGTGMGGRETYVSTDIILTIGGANMVEGDIYRCTAWYFMDDLEPKVEGTASASPSEGTPSSTPSASPSEGTPSEGTPSAS